MEPAAGLPGNPSQGTPATRPKATGRPGFMSMPHRSTTPRARAAALDVVLVPHRHAAAREQQVGARGGRAQRLDRGVEVVGRAADVDHVGAHALEERPEQRPVAVVQAAGRQRRPGLGELVAGGDHGHPRSAHDREPVRAHGGRHAKVEGTQPPPGGQREGAARHVAARAAHVGAGARLGVRLRRTRPSAATSASSTRTTVSAPTAPGRR